MEHFEFTGAQGFALSARIDKPKNSAPRAYALFAHCFTCGKDLQPANRIAKALTNDGIAVVRFDFTGLGKSDGDFANTNFSSNVADLLAAAEYMRTNLEAPSLMIGHSLGGTASLIAAKEIPEIRAVVTIGAPANTTNIIKQFPNYVTTIEKEGQATIKLAGRDFTIQKQFLDDIQNQNIEDTVAALKKPLLVCHSPIDETVNIDHAGKIFVAAKHPKSFLSLDNADHLLFKKGAAEYVARSIAGWVSAYIPEQENDSHKTDVKYGDVLVHPTGIGKFQHHVHAGPYTMIADEPKSYGGDEAGPTPYSFLLAGLGACTSMTLKMYAERKNIDLQDVQIHMTHEKIHADDCDSCETKSGKLDKISRRITLSGNLTPEQRARLIEIADRCPVHRTLHEEVLIETKET